MIGFSWLRYFAWVPLLAILVGIGAVATRVQVLFSYEFSGRVYGYAGLQGRTYTRCTYVGFAGTTTRLAESGRCQWFRLPLTGGR